MKLAASLGSVDMVSQQGRRAASWSWCLIYFIMARRCGHLQRVQLIYPGLWLVPLVPPRLFDADAMLLREVGWSKLVILWSRRLNV